MRRIGSAVVIIQVAPDTGGRERIVINTVMALVAGDREMCAGQLPVIIVNGEGGRCPAGIGSMAVGTGCGNAGSCMVRICSGIIICQMAADTGSRERIVINTVMALVAGGR